MVRGDWKCPEITVGGVPIVEQDFTWALTAGVNPYITSIQVPKGTLYENLKALKNPVEIKMIVTGGLTGFPETRIETFKNIYLLEGKEISDYETLWTLADSRWSWRGKKIKCSYNKTRQKNSVGISVSPSETNPSALRQQFDTFSVGRYLDWSVLPDGTPYNMQTIIEIELKKLGITVFRNIEGDKGSYIVENVRLDHVDIYQGVASLLARSRLQLGIKPDGSVYVYSLDFADSTKERLLIDLQTNAKVRPGTVYKQDKSRMRPKFITVKFEKKVEVRVVNTSSESRVAGSPMPIPSNQILWNDEEKNFYPRTIIGCENVIRIPYPTKSLDSTRDYSVGEYVPMWEYLKAIQVTEDDVQKLWFGDLLWRKYALQIETQTGSGPTENNERYAAQIINNIRTHYRQVFQLDPFYMDRIMSWEACRVGVMDNYSHFSPPSPLFADYCVVPRLRHPKLAKNQGLWNKSSYNWRIQDRDPYREKPTAGSISILNMALGLFRVNYPIQNTEVIAEIIPSAVYPEPHWILSSSHPIWQSVGLSSLYDMDTIVSVVYEVVGAADRFDDYRKYFEVIFDYTKEGGTGPPMEYLSNLEYARYRVTQESDNLDTLQGSSQACVNESLLKNLASAEAAKIVNQFRDRLGGVVTFAGFLNTELFGHMRTVIYNFSPAEGLTTTIDMRDMPPAKLLEEFLTQDQLDYLNRHVSRRDNNKLMETL